jgi:hypothetical protein
MLEFRFERFVAPDAAVDGLVEGNEEPGGLLIVPDLDAERIIGVIEQGDRLAHKAERCLVEPAVESHGTILVDLATHRDAEVIA